MKNEYATNARDAKVKNRISKILHILCVFASWWLKKIKIANETDNLQ